MKSLIFLGFASALLVNTQAAAQKRTEQQVASDAIWASHHAVTEFKENGMIGLIDDVKKCYDTTMMPAYKCIYLDVAAWHIDIGMAAALNLPTRNDYLSNDAINKRMNDQLKSAGMDEATEKAEISSVIGLMSAAVDHEMQSSAGHQ